MDSINQLIMTCKAYKNEEFEIEEFQKRLETIYLPDQMKNTLEKEQHNAYNRLEEILFSYKEENQRFYANQVADNLMSSAQKYQQ